MARALLQEIRQIRVQEDGRLDIQFAAYREPGVYYGRTETGGGEILSLFYPVRPEGKTGVDLPGEAGTIMHKMEDMKAVELATVSFGQSFQITPIQLATTVSSIINGGNRITPHLR